MNDDKNRKVIGRWKKGGQRNKREDSKILTKLQSQRRPGWRNGARVYARPAPDLIALHMIASRIRTTVALARVGRYL